jgi:hypothetical protein
VKPQRAQLTPKPPKRGSPQPARRTGEPSQSSTRDPLVQTKLAVGPVSDRYEAEADRVAAHVVSGAYGPLPSISTLGHAPPGAATASRMPKPEETPKPPARKAAGPAIQRAPAQSPERLEEQLAQLEPAGPVPAGGGQAPAGVEAGVAFARQSGGQPIAPAARADMERGFGRDFSGVRVHAGSAADGLSHSLGARAFTTGTDIFFGSGEYRPHTGEGRRLLAHELTHVVQQTEGGALAQPKRIQRAKQETKAADAAAKEEEEPKVFTAPKGRSIDLTGDVPVYKLPALDLPKMLGTAKGDQGNKTIAGEPKAGFSPIVTGARFVWTGKGERISEEEEGSDAQLAIWRNAVTGAGKLFDLIETGFANKGEDIVEESSRKKIHYLQLGAGKSARGAPVLFVGTAEQLAKHDQITTPKWGRDGEYADMEVDHFHEIQLGGRHAMSNFWLLERTKNGASGIAIKTTFLGALEDLTRDADKAGFFAGGNAAKKLNSFKSYPEGVRVEFAAAAARKDARVARDYWTLDDILAGSHLKHLQPLTAQQMKQQGLIFDPKATLRNINLFLGKNSAFRRLMKVSGTELEPVGRGKAAFINGFTLESTSYEKPTTVSTDQPLGWLRGQAFGNRTIEPRPGSKEKKGKRLIEVPAIELPILSYTEAFGFGGYLDRAPIAQALKQAKARIEAFSPITIQDAGIRDDFVLHAQGIIGAETPLLAGMQIPIRMEGDAVFIDFPLPLEGLGFGPFQITQTSLQLGIREKGPFLGGTADFVIEGVGHGHVEARNLDLLGKFTFDFDAFDPAEIDVAYKDDAWSVSATLGVREGILPGIKSGSVEVTADSESFGVIGTVMLAAPGIPDGSSVTVGYTPEQGLVIGGEVALNTDRIPGVTGARMSVLVRRRPDSGEWSVNGSGTAQFGLPGVTGSLTVSWVDGILTVGGMGIVKRDPMTGSVSFLVTNQPIDEEGNPIAGPPLAEFRASGTGIVSIRFGKLLTGSVGVTVMENGEIEITGEIALPPEIPIIPEKTLPLPGGIDFPEVRFPIIGLTVPVINKSFGVFGFVRGGITLSAVVGPGVLKDTAVDVTFNPDRLEDTHIHGGSRFEMRAQAGIALSVTGGIGAGLAVIEATGEVGIRAGLGVELLGGGEIDVDWTPVKGLAVDASVFGEARPKFTIDLIARAAVVADLGWLGEYDIWSDSWSRNLGRFGPDLAVTGRLPATWSEAEGLDLDLANLDVKYPDISIRDLGESIFDAVT